MLCVIVDGVVSLALRQKSALLNTMGMILHRCMRLSFDIIRAEGLLFDHQTVTLIEYHCDHMPLLFRNLQLVLRIKTSEIGCK
jgi:hypothetical protein